jgi:hypothetical protein
VCVEVQAGPDCPALGFGKETKNASLFILRGNGAGDVLCSGRSLGRVQLRWGDAGKLFFFQRTGLLLSSGILRDTRLLRMPAYGLRQRLEWLLPGESAVAGVLDPGRNAAARSAAAQLRLGIGDARRGRCARACAGGISGQADAHARSRAVRGDKTGNPPLAGAHADAAAVGS